jgi:hypothetical protein
MSEAQREDVQVDNFVPNQITLYLPESIKKL